MDVFVHAIVLGNSVDGVSTRNIRREVLHVDLRARPFTIGHLTDRRTNDPIVEDERVDRDSLLRTVRTTSRNSVSDAAAVTCSAGDWPGYLTSSGT